MHIRENDIGKKKHITNQEQGYFNLLYDIHFRVYLQK